MLFNSYQFALFFPIVVLVYFLTPYRWRWAWLLGASYFFYMSWRWQYGFLLAWETVLNYACGLLIARSRSRRAAKAWLVTALVGSLGALFFFKYLGFAAGVVTDVLQAAGSGVSFRLADILLPVGISFYTFQALSYSIDAYRGQVEAEPHLGRFALYVAFFPQLVAGPIERATHLLQQFRRENHFDVDRLVVGAKLMAWGLFKKVVIADRLAMYVDRVYAQPSDHSGATLCVAMYFFAFQIYCDFSGYSDMAIGAARILGYDVMQNFRLPYLARSISDFWQRWHISLSTWFSDYVYIPLGGSRVSRGRWAFNIVAVFVLSGLWHGADWTFVAWGLFHGFLYLGEKTLARLVPRAPHLPRPVRAMWSVLRVLITFHLVAVGLVIFRAQSIGDALLILRSIALDMGSPLYLGPSQVTTAISASLILLLVAIQILQARGLVGMYVSPGRLPAYLRWPGYIAMVIAIGLFGVHAHSFIYFQF